MAVRRASTRVGTESREKEKRLALGRHSLNTENYYTSLKNSKPKQLSKRLSTMDRSIAMNNFFAKKDSL